MLLMLGDGAIPPQTWGQSTVPSIVPTLGNLDTVR